MGSLVDVAVPDIGDFDAVEVIEVLVAVGDVVELEQALLTLESDKASMEIPSSAAGTVEKILVKVGDSVSQGSVVVRIRQSDGATGDQGAKEAPSVVVSEAEKNTNGAAQDVEIYVPDIGDFDSVEVIEVNVAVGDAVEKEQPLVTLESDKASMEIPSTTSGIVKAINVKVGDKVSEGQTILIIEAMKTMNPIAAPRAGRVVQIFIANGDPVEYGEALLIIE